MSSDGGVEISKAIDQANSFDELIAVFSSDDEGVIVGSRGAEYTFPEIRKRLSYFRTGISSNLVTRTYGLRDRAIMLKEIDRAE